MAKKTMHQMASDSWHTRRIYGFGFGPAAWNVETQRYDLAWPDHAGAHPHYVMCLTCGHVLRSNQQRWQVKHAAKHGVDFLTAWNAGVALDPTDPRFDEAAKRRFDDWLATIPVSRTDCKNRKTTLTREE